MTRGGRVMLRLFYSIGMGPDAYFGRQLKANGALERSFDRPFAPSGEREVAEGSVEPRVASARSRA